MDYTSRETIFDELNNFEKKRPTEIPLILEDYLALIGRTGDIIFPWSKLKPLFMCKLDKVIKKFNEDYPAKDLPYSPNVEKFSYETLHSKLLNTIEGFTGAPFTIQRLCELVMCPDKHYKRIDKFMRALEKDLLVVSTIEPLVKRQRTDSETSSLVNGVTEATGSSNSLAQSPQSTDSNEEANVESTGQAEEPPCNQNGSYAYDDEEGHLNCEAEANADDELVAKEDEGQAEPCDTMETTVSSSSALEAVEQREGNLQDVSVHRQIQGEATSKNVTSNSELPPTQSSEEMMEAALSSDSDGKESDALEDQGGERVQPSSKGCLEVNCSDQRDSEVTIVDCCPDEGGNVEGRRGEEGGADTRESVIGASSVDRDGDDAEPDDSREVSEPGTGSDPSDCVESSAETVPDSASVVENGVGEPQSSPSSPSSSSHVNTEDVNEAAVETTSPSECDAEAVIENGMLPDSTPAVSTTSGATADMDSEEGGSGGGGEMAVATSDSLVQKSEPEPMDED